MIPENALSRLLCYLYTTSPQSKLVDSPKARVQLQGRDKAIRTYWRSEVGHVVDL
jgi:hypothetical protein